MLYPDPVECVIRFVPSGQSVRVPGGTTLAEAAREAGLPVATSCGQSGLCARCGLEILEGGEGIAEESADERAAKQRNRIAPNLRLACQVELTCDLVVTAPYW